MNMDAYFLDVFKRARGLGPFLSMFITFAASSILHVSFTRLEFLQQVVANLKGYTFLFHVSLFIFSTRDNRRVCW